MNVSAPVPVTGTWNLTQGVMLSNLTIQVSGLSSATQYEVMGNGLAISPLISIIGTNNNFSTLGITFQSMAPLSLKLFNASGIQVGQATFNGTTINGIGSGTLNFN